MTKTQFYGYPVPGYEDQDKELPGRLIVIEGTDGVGRSTQISLLQEWLEANGYAVRVTGMKRSLLAGRGIKAAMAGNYIDSTTMFLFYATDFADRLERDILPALRAGFVVLTDRYIYSIIARAQARGIDPDWIRNLLSMAIVPDTILYLQADLAHLIPRVLTSRGFDYWESGMDFLRGQDYYESYSEYQERILDEFEGIASEFGFERVDATGTIHDVFSSLRVKIMEALAGMKPMDLLDSEVQT
jgi:dTMP kinase